MKIVSGKKEFFATKSSIFFNSFDKIKEPLTLKKQKKGEIFQVVGK